MDYKLDYLVCLNLLHKCLCRQTWNGSHREILIGERGEREERERRERERERERERKKAEIEHRCTWVENPGEGVPVVFLRGYFYTFFFFFIYFINFFVAKIGTAATGNFLSGKKGGGGSCKQLILIQWKPLIVITLGRI